MLTSSSYIYVESSKPTAHHGNSTSSLRVAAAVVRLSHLHECLAFRWWVWPRVGPGISEGDQEDQENAIIRWYFTAAYGSCWNWWEDWLGMPQKRATVATPNTACRPQHCPHNCPTKVTLCQHLPPLQTWACTPVTAILLIQNQEEFIIH